MAEATAPGNSRTQSQRTFYCHKCSTEITPNTQEFTCPRCNSGFVEEIMGSSSSSAPRRSSRDAVPSNEMQDAAMELREVVHSMLSSVFDPPVEVQGATRRSRRRRHTPYVEIRRRDQVEAEAAAPMATVRIMRTGRGQSGMGGVFQHLMNRLGQPTTVVGPVPVNVMHIHGNPGDYAWGAGAMDAIVTQLLNQLDNYGPPPAEGDKIEALPTVTISQEQVDRTLQCSVCMDDFIFGESVRQLPCDHHYHSPCIVPWLNLHGTCPVCRKDLNGQDTSTSDDDPFPSPGDLTDASSAPTVDDPRT
ncbi:E3 ubiquitin-protein ligase RNF126-B-like [Babylonia areolata]|uniref:E3 ubiquitin-protein ligase RNF126-B-like n=1 Tax=Babylonia areolata TaxID=304850 RepID=UPI003FD3FC7A